ncbi:MAG: DUF1553 domain-containing protein [Saprospiraceae bacterium]|nr:DUF1553 domain-containing protein [Saprospiraceae bacterium]
MSNWCNKFSCFLVFLTLASCGPEVPEAVKVAEVGLPQLVDYNFHVRPILSDKCFACHGPDAENRQAGLRLDRAEDAFKGLENGKGKAIVPKHPGKSEAYLRMIATADDQLMPPPDSHLKLSGQEIAIIKRWIEQGAEYKPHWAFVPPVKSKLPKVEDETWVQQPMDHYVLDKLQRSGLTPSERASKETLIRRVTFDLTGLPPTLDEIDDFLEDDSDGAYEKVVDRLLAAATYGERMAAEWMDVARYADSDGYLDDKHRAFYPWRDWVINAFNQNMSYDQFISWQIAGDQIPDASKESTLATAFNRLHKKNSEAGIVFEEYRVEYVADRTNTLGKGILGLSLECARCHDHKYDPISQKDYYQLFGFFNSTFEMGTPVYGPGQVPGPALLLSSEAEDVKIDEIKAMIKKLEGNVEEKYANEAGFQAWAATLAQTYPIGKGIESANIAYYPFDKLKPSKNDKVFQSANLKNTSLPAEVVEPIHKEGFKGKALYVSDYNRIKLGDKLGWYDRTDDFSFQLQLKPDTVYDEVGVLWHAESLRLGLKGYSLHLADNRVRFIMAMSWPQNAIQVTSKASIEPKKWSQVTVTYDGSSQAEGVTLFIDGQKQEVEIDYNNLYKSILFKPDIHTYGFSGMTLGVRDKFIPFKKGGLDELKIFDRQLSHLEVLQTFDPEKAEEVLAHKKSNLDLLRNHYFLVEDQAASVARKELKQARAQENALISDIEEIMVMGDLPSPRPTFVLDRGSYDAPAAQVEPSTPESVLAFDEDYPKNRYGLSQWLFQKDHPLTARVFVNRIWQMHFGKGIVRTSDDFGAQGSLPSHPHLLDWLAIYFMESGWDIKALHKVIVTSATYQQSSRVSKQLLEKDPENVLLSRGPRYRLPAEMIRDNALAVSGLLVQKQGGSSVYPYQPEGLWDVLTTKHWAYRYLQENGDGLYRRSIYTIWKRQSPPPYMQIFDVANRGDCEVNRTLSSTPLQALNLLNDPQFVEASRVLAERLLQTEPEPELRLEKLFRLLTGRKPDLAERKMLDDFYQEELKHFTEQEEQALAFMNNGAQDWDKDLNTSEVAALGIVASSIMNTTEAFTKK